MTHSPLDLETCSWCTEEVPDSTLREAPDGARICRACQREAQEEADRRVYGHP